MHKLLVPFFLPVLGVGFAYAADSAISRTIDTQKSVLTVRVFKAGLFSGFAHDHEISAPIQEGSFESANPSVQFKVDARKLRVGDKDVSEKDRADIQQTMLGPKVLDSERFPEIRFRSTRVEHLAGDKWLVHGELTVHGQTGTVKVDVREENGHYRGTAELKQKDFGIIPVSLGGGTVKVKNELRVEFDIVGRQSGESGKTPHFQRSQVTLLVAPASNSVVKSKEVPSPTGRIIGQGSGL